MNAKFTDILMVPIHLGDIKMISETESAKSFKRSV